MWIWDKDDSDYDYDNEETYAHRAHILIRMSSRLIGETDCVVLTDNVSDWQYWLPFRR